MPLSDQLSVVPKCSTLDSRQQSLLMIYYSYFLLERKIVFRYSALTAIAAIAIFTLPAQASVNSVFASCSGGGNCVALVQAEIAGLTDTAAHKNRLIANTISSGASQTATAAISGQQGSAN
ncbi:hypothetical protein [Rhizobium sp. C1]|uniref:hypothetical protein n=1 Tax=Rhizobium sp. C1 TaxID=1349799 RepID=UPI001E33B9AF|nr:hypothetical protein [Rhizobium sp. C1]